MAFNPSGYLKSLGDIGKNPDKIKDEINKRLEETQFERSVTHADPAEGANMYAHVLRAKAPDISNSPVMYDKKPTMEEAYRGEYPEYTVPIYHIMTHAENTGTSRMDASVLHLVNQIPNNREKVKWLGIANNSINARDEFHGNTPESRMNITNNLALGSLGLLGGKRDAMKAQEQSMNSNKDGE